MTTYFDDIVRAEPISSEFSHLATAEEIADLAREKTLDRLLEEEPEFIKEFPNPHWAEMRLDYLAYSEEQSKFELLMDLYHEGELINHLMETQRWASRAMKEKKEVMRKSWLAKGTSPEEYEQLERGLVSGLREIIIKEIIER